MAGYIGQMEAFDVASEDWPTYIERMEWYLEVNEILSEKNM